MSYFYTSPTSNIPPQTHPSAIRMTRTGSSSSATSTASNSSSISIPSSRPGSTSASFCSSYWPSSSTCSSPSSYTNRSSHSRHNSNGTSYLPTPFRSALLHSSSAASSPYSPHGEPSSYFSDDELLSMNLESVHLEGTSIVPIKKREMTTEEQVAAVREQVELEKGREGGKNEPWWLQGVPAQQAAVTGMEKRSRVVRFAGETRRSSGQGKRRSVGGGGGRGSSRRD